MYQILVSSLFFLLHNPSSVCVIEINSSSPLLSTECWDHTGMSPIFIIFSSFPSHTRVLFWGLSCRSRNTQRRPFMTLLCLHCGVNWVHGASQSSWLTQWAEHSRCARFSDGDRRSPYCPLEACWQNVNYKIPQKKNTIEWVWTASVAALLIA